MANLCWPEPIRSSSFALFCFVAMFFANSTFVQAQSPSLEYKLKAVYLFNFLQYVEFPANAFPDDKTPIVIGVLGTDPFGKLLDETVAGEKINGRAIEVHRFASMKEIKNCHLLFISDSEGKRLDSILATLKGKSILTVSDLDNFAVRGGMIRFVTENNKIRFRINVDVARSADLTISAKLLQLAQIVPTEKRP